MTTPSVTNILSIILVMVMVLVDVDDFVNDNNDGLSLTLSPLTSRFSIPGLPWVIHTFYTIHHYLFYHHLHH